MSAKFGGAGGCAAAEARKRATYQVDPEIAVASVSPTSPAARAGLAPGDILLSIDGSPVRSGPDWLLLLSGRKAGGALAIEFERGGRKGQASLTLVTYPLVEASSRKGKQPGLHYALYRPAWSRSGWSTSREAVVGPSHSKSSAWMNPVSRPWMQSSTGIEPTLAGSLLLLSRRNRERERKKKLLHLPWSR